MANPTPRSAFKSIPADTSAQLIRVLTSDMDRIGPAMTGTELLMPDIDAELVIEDPI